MRISPNVHFDPRLLCSWEIINGIAREGSPCASVPPSLAPENKHCGSGTAANVACAKCTQI